LWTHYSCPADGYGSQVEYSWNNYRVYCKILDNILPVSSEITSSLNDNW
jgi:hypothetical protein